MQLTKFRGLWVSKPGVGALTDVQAYGNLRSSGLHLHMGIDVKVFASPEQWIEITDGEAREENCVSEYRVLQKYVEQPLLWDGRKADIRLHTLTISAQPPVHYVYFGQVPVRVSRFPYSEEDFDKLVGLLLSDYQALSLCHGCSLSRFVLLLICVHTADLQRVYLSPTSRCHSPKGVETSPASGESCAATSRRNTLTNQSLGRFLRTVLQRWSQPSSL